MTTPTAAAHRWLPQDPGWVLELAGDWRGNAAALLLGPPAPRAVRIACAGLQAWDAGLAATLREALAPLARAGLELQLDELPHEVRAVLELALHTGRAAAASTVAPGATPLHPGVVTSAEDEPLLIDSGWLPSLGQRVVLSARRAIVTVNFLGEVLLALARLLKFGGGGSGSSGLRPRELWRQFDLAGPLSVPIVTLTCFLIGLMLAYMSGAQLERMGAQRFIADIVTVGMVRELAGLMTGVILAGRIGSAYAAQLATMKAGEEIDALRALGVDPIDHLVLPRVLALILVAPLLWAYAALVGVLAGVVPATGVYGVAPREYLSQALDALTWPHLWIGVFKCTLYGALLALAGCREGLHAGRNAQAVGAATTAAVVMGLVWIVAAACLSTVVFQSLGY